LKKKEDILFAKKVLKYDLDPYISNNRDVWILVCRILKTICKGGTELLESFINWTKLVEPDGDLRSKSCINAWKLQRPVTNCDYKALTKARVFLRERGINLILLFLLFINLKLDYFIYIYCRIG
jgi:hypothetical protein